METIAIPVGTRRARVKVGMSFLNPEYKQRSRYQGNSIGLVELVGIEPTTSSLRTMRSPS